MTRALLILALAAITPAGLQAQTFRGRLVESESREPIVGAFVLLYPASGDASAEAPALDAALTGADGHFSLSAPRAGLYRLRVDRIGYQGHLTAPFELTSAGAAETTITSVVEPIELPVITARVEAPCEIDASASERFGAVWEEARKALATAIWSEREGVYRITALRYERVFDRSGRVVDSHERVREGLRRDSPYLGQPADELARGGYVRFEGDSVRFYVPDAEALLSDVFLEGHCFRLVPGEREDLPGWIGLEFEPVPGRPVPDIAGVMWIDRATSGLRRLDLGYTGLPDRLARHLPAARMEFTALPTGAWIVRKWSIRAPVVARTGPRELAGYSVMGGEVTSIATPSREPIATWEAETVVRGGAVLTGRITTATGKALPGAVVSAGSARGAADEQGRFRIEGLPAGRTRLTFTSERLAALGWISPPLFVELAVAGATEITFVAPSDEEIAATLCPGSEKGAVVTGVMRVGGSIPGDADITASWSEGARRVIPVEKDGRYVVCGVPAGRVFLLAAAGESARRFDLDVAPGTVVMAFDLSLPGRVR